MRLLWGIGGKMQVGGLLQSVILPFLLFRHDVRRINHSDQPPAVIHRSPTNLWAWQLKRLTGFMSNLEYIYWNTQSLLSKCLNCPVDSSAVSLDLVCHRLVNLCIISTGPSYFPMWPISPPTSSTTERLSWIKAWWMQSARQWAVRNTHTHGALQAPERSLRPPPR